MADAARTLTKRLVVSTALTEDVVRNMVTVATRLISMFQNYLAKAFSPAKLLIFTAAVSFQTAVKADVSLVIQRPPHLIQPLRLLQRRQVPKSQS